MNQENIEREFESFRRDEAAARSILDAAAAEGRDLTAEEEASFNAATDAAAIHRRRADRLVAMDTDAAALAAAVRASIGEPSAPESGRPASGTLTGDQQLVAAIRSTAQAYQRGLLDHGASGVALDLPIDEAAVLRTITDFGNGSALYASDFSTRVAVYARTMSPWLSQATVISADNGRPLILPALTADPTGYSPGEGTAITAADPTLGTATATPTSYKALAYVSMEAEEDEVVGLLQLISQSQGRSLGLMAGSAFTAGVLSAATNGGTATGKGGGGGTAGTAVNAFIGYEDLLDLKYGAAAPYRLTGAWVMSNGAIKVARKFRDGNGQYLWQPAVAAGQPDIFDGQAVFEDPFLAAPASATKSVVYGDLSAWVVKQMALRVATSPDFKFDLDVVALKSVLRAGGALPVAAALRYLVSANT